MKKLISLLTLTLLVGFTYAQVETVAPAAAADGPVMTFEAMEVNYGTIDQGSDPLRTFAFTNTGTAPLQITNAKGSCGCTVPSYPKEPIFPGESGVIEVRYDTKRVGKFMKRVTLTTNEGGDKKTLTIKGEVLKAEEAAPAVPASEPSIFNPNGGK